MEPLRPEDPREVAGYVLRGWLGSGGMGTVYLSHTPGGQPVALKVVRREYAQDREFRRRFAREVEAARRVQGPYTAQVLDSDTDEAMPWLASAYVAGPSLAAAIGEHGPLPVRTVTQLMAGVAEALQSIHAARVIHRDLKPANVMLASDGPRVIDFGIAHAADSTTVTETGVRLGTPAYMAPEQVTGGRATPALDVFALGLLTHFAATSRHPFGEGQGQALLFRIVSQEPELAACPRDLRPLIARCLAKEPGDRPSPAEIIDACRKLGGRTALQRGTDWWLPRPVAQQVARREDTVRAAPGAGREARPDPDPDLEQAQEQDERRQAARQAALSREPTEPDGRRPTPAPSPATPRAARYSPGSWAAAVLVVALLIGVWASQLEGKDGGGAGDDKAGNASGDSWDSDPDDSGKPDGRQGSAAGAGSGDSGGSSAGDPDEGADADLDDSSAGGPADDDVDEDEDVDEGHEEPVADPTPDPTPEVTLDATLAAYQAVRTHTCLRTWMINSTDWAGTTPEMIDCDAESAGVWVSEISDTSASCPVDAGRSYLSYSGGGETVALCVNRLFRAGQCFLGKADGSANLMSWVDCGTRTVPSPYNRLFNITDVGKIYWEPQGDECRKASGNQQTNHYYWTVQPPKSEDPMIMVCAVFHGG
jgi:hypothetical protein